MAKWMIMALGLLVCVNVQADNNITSLGDNGIKTGSLRYLMVSPFTPLKATKAKFLCMLQAKMPHQGYC